MLQTLGGFGDDERVVTLDDIIGDDETAPYRQTVHEIAIVSPGHVLAVNCPRHVFAQYLTIVGGTGDTRATPVLGIDEMGSFESLALVVLHTGVAHKTRV